MFPAPIVSRVEDTNDDAQISKLSCVRLGYFDDPYVHLFVRQPVRRPPIINRGYWARYASVRGVVLRFLVDVATRDRAKQASDAGERPGLRDGNEFGRGSGEASPRAGADANGAPPPAAGASGPGARRGGPVAAPSAQILSLGAGFDTLPLQLLAESVAPGLYVEVDLPEVAKRKAERLRSCPELRRAVGEELREGQALAQQEGPQRAGQMGDDENQDAGKDTQGEMKQGERSAIGEVKGGEAGSSVGECGAASGAVPRDESGASSGAASLSSPSVAGASVSSSGAPSPSPPPPCSLSLPPPRRHASGDALSSSRRSLPLRTRHYRLVGGDLRDWSSTWARVVDPAQGGLDPSKPTLVLLECVSAYLSLEAGEKLLRGLARDLRGPCAALLYDPASPEDAFGRTMARNLAARGCPLLGVRGGPREIEARLLAAGFGRAESRTMLQAYLQGTDPDERRRIERLEIFDELEEWTMLMDHYALSLAVNPGKRSKGKRTEGERVKNAPGDLEQTDDGASGHHVGEKDDEDSASVDADEIWRGCLDALTLQCGETRSASEGPDGRGRDGGEGGRSALRDVVPSASSGSTSARTGMPTVASPGPRQGHLGLAAGARGARRGTGGWTLPNAD